MKNSFKIDSLNTAEKIQLMEKLWIDLSSDTDYPLPEWHYNELGRRKRAVAEGKQKYTDWEVAKQEIREDLK